MKESMQAYLARPEPSASGFSMLMKNARKYWLTKQGKISEPSREKDIGSVAHACVLEPEIAHEMFVVDDNISEEIVELSKMNPDDLIVVDAESRRHGEYQRMKKANPHKKVILAEEMDTLMAYLKIKDKIILSSAEYDLVKTLVGKVMELENFKTFLAGGIKEETFVGEIDDTPVRCRPDLMYVMNDGIKTDNGLIPVMVFDVKSMFSDINHDGFAKASGERDYYMSEVLCRNILMQNGYEVIDYSFVGVSKVEWSGAEYFQHDDIALMRGETLLRNAIKKYQHCEKNKIWPEKQFDFYAQKFLPATRVSLPTYVFYKHHLPEEY